ncbi:MAG: hypothetical protein AAFR04_13425 [Pseudomonadota bacterium]
MAYGTAIDFGDGVRPHQAGYDAGRAQGAGVGAGTGARVHASSIIATYAAGGAVLSVLVGSAMLTHLWAVKGVSDAAHASALAQTVALVLLYPATGVLWGLATGTLLWLSACLRGRLPWWEAATAGYAVAALIVVLWLTLQPFGQRPAIEATLVEAALAIPASLLCWVWVTRERQPRHGVQETVGEAPATAPATVEAVFERATAPLPDPLVRDPAVVNAAYDAPLQHDQRAGHGQASEPGLMASFGPHAHRLS